MLKFELSVHNDDKVRHELEQMAERASNPSPVFNRIADLLYAGIQMQFASQGAFLGEPWPRLSSESKNAGRPALESLKSTFTVRRIGKTKITIGSRHPLVRIHQGGATEGRRGKLPPRPMAGIAKGTTRRATKMLTDYLVG